MSRRPETNVEFVTNLMEFSRHGALAQIFVIDAILKWSEIVAQHDPAEINMGGGFVSAEAWVGVAKEIKAKIEERNRRG
jgi:hypothetical protein